MNKFTIVMALVNFVRAEERDVKPDCYCDWAYEWYGEEDYCMTLDFNDCQREFKC